MNVVLLIAEDRGIREAITASLQDTCLVLFEAGVEEALRWLITVRADAIILDDTPSLGRKALGRLRQAAPQTPVIALSSRGDAETRAEFILSGARACLSKPFAYDELMAALDDAAKTQPQQPTPTVSRVGEVGGSSAVTQYQTAMRWLNRATSEIGDPPKLNAILADALADVFDPVRCAILREKDGVVFVAANHGIAVSVTQSLRLDYSTGLLRWFEENPYLIDRQLTRATGPAVKEMLLLGARLGAPILCGGHVVGALLIGDKSSGRDYSGEERELLALMARSASTALDNAREFQEVSQQQVHLKTVLSHITAGVVVVNGAKSVILMNESAEQILQVSASDSLGRSVQKLGSGFADVVLRTLAEGKPQLRQEVRDPAIGAILGISAAPLESDGAVVIFSCLPEERAPAEDIAYSPYWEYLSARVAQEIKNPLVAINTFAQLLPRKYDSDEFRNQFGDVVQKEVSRINRVVENLFDFARHPRLVLQTGNLNDTIQQVLQGFKEKAAERSVTIETELSSALPKLDYDPLFYSQALHNVVQNAFDAVSTGGTVRVISRRQGEWCEVLVSDTGPGVADQVAPLVFLPFFSTREQGMGLGLTVANRILKSMQGDLRLVSSNSGAAFTLTLPLQSKQQNTQTESRETSGVCQ